MLKNIFALCFILTGSWVPGALLAEDLPMRNESGVLVENLPLSLLANFKRSQLNWQLSKGEEAVFPRHIVEGSGYSCITLATTLKGSTVLYEFKNSHGSGSLNPVLNKLGISCNGNKGGKGKNPSFRLYVSANVKVLQSHGLDLNADIRAVIVSGSNETAVDMLPWKLQAKKDKQWLTIGGLNVPDFSNSSWVEDPENSGEVALRLVAESNKAKSENINKEKVQKKDTRIFSLDNHVNPVRYLRTGAVAPVIAWREGENADTLRFEVVEESSSPNLGRYCIRPVFYRNNSAFVFNFDEKTGHYSTGDTLNRSDDACNNNDHLSFYINITVDVSSVRNRTVRFIVNQIDETSPLFYLQRASIKLRRVHERTTIAEYVDDNGGFWFYNDQNLAELYIEPSKSDDDDVPLALRFFHNDPRVSLMLEGTQVDIGEIYKHNNSFGISWDASVASVSEIKVCMKTACRDVLATFTPDSNPFVMQRDHFTGLTEAVLDIVWGVPGEAQQSATFPTIATTDDQKINVTGDDDVSTEFRNMADAQPGIEDNSMTGSALRVNAYLTFGNYSKPLTACVGRMSSASSVDSIGEPFTLQQGIQIVSDKSWPEDAKNDTLLQIHFDKKRNGGDCVVDGLVSKGVTKSELISKANTGNIELPIESPAPLFIGYIQLNSQEYKKSRARWLDSLSFFNNIYRFGRTETTWIDALLLGAGDARGEPKPILELPGNFAEQLGSAAQRDAVVEAQVQRSDVLTDSFSQTLSGIKSIVGTADIVIMYFDDSMESFSCEDYAEDLADSGLNITSVIVITSKADYTGDDSKKSLANGLAHVCAQNDSGLVVYAFDSSEQHKERQWDEAFGAMFDHFVETGKL